MIGRAGRWGYANARLRTHVGRLMPRARLHELCHLSLPDAIGRLTADPPDGIVWPDLPEGGQGPVTPGLYLAYETHFLALARMLDGPCRLVFEMTLEHVIVDDLKALIRRIVGDHTTEGDGEPAFVAIGRSPLIPDLGSVTTLDALDEALAGTVYLEPYRLARETYGTRKDVLPFEVALDLDFHRRLHRAIATLPAEDARATGHLFRRQCDVKNVGWILRYRFNYGLQEVEIFNYALSTGLEVDDDRIMQLARIADPGRVIAVLADTRLGRWLSSDLGDGGGSLSVLDVEASLDRFWEQAHRDALSGPPFGLAPFMAYQALKELERDRLQRILVGLQLDVGASDIVDGLWLPREAHHVPA